MGEDDDTRPLLPIATSRNQCRQARKRGHTGFCAHLAPGFLFVMGATLCMSLVFAALTYCQAKADHRLRHACPPFARCTSWAMYSPYFPVEAYAPPPDGCTITQVNIIQRHGARYPTSRLSRRIVASLNKIQSVQEYLSPSLSFLNDYTYTLRTSDLVPYGARQSNQAGQEVYQRYASIISQDNIPFLRASGSARVVSSAKHWAAGFSLASNHLLNPPLSVVLSEDHNNTLENAMCPNAGDSDAQTHVWISNFAYPIAERLNEQAPGANLTAADIYSLMALCPFESVAEESISPWCSVFTATEFEKWSYYGDLDKYYFTGYGQPLGRVQGVGYVNELIARLTGRPVQDHTQTNRTLDESPRTFPLDRSVYADFSHDNQMIAIYAALGLFSQTQALDPMRPDPGRDWNVSRMVPFSARMVTERLVCNGRKDGELFVRILVDDVIQPLTFCGAGRDGICELSAFVDSQQYSRSSGAGDFEKCFD